MGQATKKSENNSQLKRKPSGRQILLVLLLLVGLAIMLYPVITQYIYQRAAIVEVEQFVKDAETLEAEDIEERLALANAFNYWLYEQRLGGTQPIASDPYTEEQQAEGRDEYGRMLEINEEMGYVSIPKIGQKLPMYAGTSEGVLQKGAGHLEGTSLPVGGENTHSVITAHTGLPEAELFTDLDQLEADDIFYIHNIEGTMAYQVDDIKVVEPHEVQALAILSGEDYVTLLTCTPYMVNTHRLLVRGHRIPYDEFEEEKSMNDISNTYQILFWIMLVLFIIFLFDNWRLRRKVKQLKNEIKALETQERLTD